MASPIVDGEHMVEAGPVPLDRALRAAYPRASWNVVRRAISTGKVRVGDAVVRDIGHVVEAGDQIAVRMTAPRRPRIHLPDDAIVHLDAQVVVVCKPPGMATVPDETRRRGTLVQLVGARISQRGRRNVPLGVVQRLDVDTSGILVFARTAEARDALKEQFRSREVLRSYLALVAGKASDKTIRSRLVERRDGTRGSTRNPHIGKYACTHVEVVERLRGASLVRCVLETGRTHQIRIHLSEDGHPLLGDKRYARRAVVAHPAPRVMLHAASLGFRHPVKGGALRFEQPLPDDMARLVAELQRRR